jgi:serine/threonine protein kinase/tetratricopeptide (TPR) repeat protein
MTPATADRNLLFGILALQLEFVTRDELVAAMQAWVLDKARPLGQVFVEQGVLGRLRRDLLEALVQEHLADHDHDAGRSLASLSPAGFALPEITDSDLRASLAIGSTARPAEDVVPDTRPPDSLSETREPAWASPSAGGRYRVLRPHARGGIGEVFVARDEELHREVALKELQGGVAGRAEARARFVVEAEITGGLEHPGIVPVYGLGRYADGRPYYAMRFIRGESLQEAIARFHAPERAGRDLGERRLELRQLLSRFVAVCNAIAYAHSRGVLHRDLKPANVMLGKYGETLVVDWGLAKTMGQAEGQNEAEESLVRPVSASDSAATQMGQVIGTPAYMSPEQAEGRLDRLGPASDTYSLGAMLYHLLTGQAPISKGDLTEVLDKVRQGAFPRPRQIRRTVPAGLEAICLKAMAARPEDRYPSTKDLAEDVEHWLADEPVSAHRESVAVRLRRWGRRHRPLVTGSLALLGTMVLALVVSTVLLSRANEETRKAYDDLTVEKRKADDSERLAQTRAKTARRVSEFLIGLFESSDPIGLHSLGFRTGRDNPREMTAQQLLDRGRERLDSGLQEEPAVRAALLDVLGNVYRSMGLYRQAEPLLLAALTDREKFGPDDLETANCMHNVAWLLHDLGDYDKARPLYEKALALRLAQLGPEDPLTVTSKFHLAWVLADDGEYDQAEKLFKEVIDQRRKRFGDDSREVAIALGGYVGTLIDQKHWGELVSPLVELKAILGKRKEGEALLNALGAFQSGMLHKQSGDLQKLFGSRGKAQESFREAIRLSVPVLGDGHPYVALMRFELADDLENSGDLRQAEGLYRNCIQIARDTMGLQHPRAIAPVNKLAHLLYQKKDGSGKEEARRLLTEFREARQKRFGNDHRQTIEATALFGWLEARFGDDSRAEPLLREAAAAGDRAVKEPVWLSDCHFYLGRIRLQGGRPAEAEPYFRRALAIDRARKPDSEDVAIGLQKLATALMDQKKYDECEPMLKEALALCGEASDRRDTRFDVLESWARLHVDLGRYKEAGPLLDEALELTRKLKDASEFKQARAWHNRALVRLVAADDNGYRRDCAEMLDRFAAGKDVPAANAAAWTAVLAPEAIGDPGRAITLAQKVVTTQPKNARYRTTLGAALYRAGKFDEAVRELNEARATWPDKEGSRFDWLFLAMVYHRRGEEDKAREFLAKEANRAQRDVELSFDQRLELLLLRREAEVLLNPTLRPPK